MYIGSACVICIHNVHIYELKKMGEGRERAIPNLGMCTCPCGKLILVIMINLDINKIAVKLFLFSGKNNIPLGKETATDLCIFYIS